MGEKRKKRKGLPRENSQITLFFAKKLMDVLETNFQNCEIAPFQECTKAKKGLILKTDYTIRKTFLPDNK